MECAFCKIYNQKTSGKNNLSKQYFILLFTKKYGGVRASACHPQ